MDALGPASALSPMKALRPIFNGSGVAATAGAGQADRFVAFSDPRCGGAARVRK